MKEHFCGHPMIEPTPENLYPNWRHFLYCLTCQKIVNKLTEELYYGQNAS